jgi:Pyridoxamine 5'-phosphate oxidase
MKVSEERLQHIRGVLKSVRHIALATVNVDGTPHNSPVFSAHDNALQFVWSSHPESLHSKNIMRTGRAFIVVFDSVDKGGGLYIDVDAQEVAPQRLPVALAVFNARLKDLGREAVGADVLANSGQCLYQATPRKLWINMAERDQHGHIIKDQRYEIFAADIIN